MPPATQPSQNWRSDLEGLRVVAIALVAVYHVWLGRVSGGVDIFLLLSGYFVGGSLWRRFSNDQPPNARQYLARHARRLLPASVTVLAATLVGVVIILPITRWSGASLETLASLTYWENWYFIATSGEYGGVGAEQSPWQHFWSLSVQGQLFVGLPVLLWLVWSALRTTDATKRRRHLTAVIVAVTLASFVYACVLTTVNQPVAYFNTFARSWEFLGGMLVAMALGAWRPKSTVWKWLAWPALLIILAFGALVPANSLFPGPVTLVPLAAAVTLIFAGSLRDRAGAITRVLGSRWVAPLGKYAYSFYLWHWPILVLFVARSGYVPGPRAGAAILLLSAALAFVTFHLIETPLRGSTARTDTASKTNDPDFRRSSVTFVAIASVVITALPAAWVVQTNIQRAEYAASVSALGEDFDQYPGALSHLSPELYGDVPSRAPIPAVEVAATDLSQVYTDGCVTLEEGTELKHCEYGSGTKARVAIFGASHVEHFFEVYEAIAESEGWTLVPILKRACPPTTPELAWPNSSCKVWLDDAYEYLETGDFDLIITDATYPDGNGNDEVLPGFISMFQRVSEYAPVLAVRDTARMSFNMLDCYAAGDACDVPLYSRISQEDPTATITMNRVQFLDVNDLICPESICSPVVGNRVVYRDFSHFTRTFVISLIPDFSARVKEKLSESQML